MGSANPGSLAPTVLVSRFSDDSVVAYAEAPKGKRCSESMYSALDVTCSIKTESLVITVVDVLTVVLLNRFHRS